MSLSDLVAGRSIAAAKRRARANVEANMLSQVRITRSDAPTIDSDGLLVADETPAVVYEGRARLTSATGPVTYTLGEEVQFFSSAAATIPVTLLSRAQPPVVSIVDVAINDLLEVLGSDDPMMTGKRFRVVDVELQGILVSSRKLQLVGINRYGGWVDDVVRHPATGYVPDEIPPDWHV